MKVSRFRFVAFLFRNSCSQNYHNKETIIFPMDPYIQMISYMLKTHEQEPRSCGLYLGSQVSRRRLADFASAGGHDSEADKPPDCCEYYWLRV